MPSKAKTSGAVVVREDKTARAVELRTAGFSYPQIASMLNVCTATAFNYVSRAIERTRKEANETADQIRTVEVARLDRMLAVLTPLADEGDLAAMDRILKIQERRAAYLGLDAPKAQLVAVDGRPDTVRALMALVAPVADKRAADDVVEMNGGTDDR